MSNICTDCLHWIGEPHAHCELGPDQEAICIRAHTESLEQEARLYLVDAYEVHDSYRRLVGSEHLVAPSWEEALTEAGPHWPTSCRLRVRECSEAELDDYSSVHYP